MSTKENIHQAPVEVGGYTIRSAKFVKAAVNLKGLAELHFDAAVQRLAVQVELHVGCGILIAEDTCLGNVLQHKNR